MRRASDEHQLDIATLFIHQTLRELAAGCLRKVAADMGEKEGRP
jgi:hypothetical protein